MFKDIQKQLEEALKGQIDGNFEFVDLKPEFIKKNPMFRTGGFRVKVTRSGDGPPSIDIKAFGDVDEELAAKMNEAIRAKAEAERAAQNYPTFDGEPEGPEEPEEPEEDLPEAREVSGYSEPTANTTWAGDHVVVDLDLPGVESLEDISIKKLDESIEVRAYAGDKGYFKILSIPKDAKMLDKSFDSNKLTIRIG
jgi:HSP20 family molecular chaperone IbpA